MTERTALYRLYDADDRLLYVGISSNPHRRWKQHALEHAKTWWPDVRGERVQWFESRREAEVAELAAIRTEGAIHNRAHVPTVADRDQGWQPPKQAASPRAKAAKEALFLRGLAVDKESRRRKISMPELVAEQISQQITSGDYDTGAQLPGVVSLAFEFGVSQLTVRRGLQLLVAQGLVSRSTGKALIVGMSTSVAGA
jgi:predicted GIY-YIG superfamily endonuclease